jgi:murein DD-endopeptidase MepM/ murein hydrolase activator NlpD
VRAVLLAITLGSAALAPCAGAFELVTPQGPIAQGDVFLVALRQLPPGARVDGWWRGAPVAFAPAGDGEWLALVGVDFMTAPRRYVLTLGIALPGAKPVRRRCLVEVASKRFGVQRLRLPEEHLDAPTLARIGREAQALSALWPQRTPERLWRGAFILPVPGERSTSFGVARFINGRRRAPHSGVDLRGDLGEPVRAINRGRVVLVGDFLLTGLSLVLDHGQGLFSMYFHLSEIRVARGDLVEQGVPIGLVGSTGRSTGPHLHWGIRLDRARVDPFSLIAETSGLPASPSPSPAPEERGAAVAK